MRVSVLSRYICVLLTLLPTLVVLGNNQSYRIDIGLQAGGGYYVGDAAQHIFNNPLDVYGLHLRYKFDQRWSLQAKTLRHRITFRDPKRVINYNVLWNTDICAEFNFFRFGVDEYDNQIKPISPYMFLGFGVAVIGRQCTTTSYPLFIGQNGLQPMLACYLPFGFGVKWKFAKRWQLHLTWQHNLYLGGNGDAIEGFSDYCNKHDLNGTNFLNNDLTGQLTIGIVFELAKEKKICQWCTEE